MKYYYLDEEVVAISNDGKWVRREDHEAEVAKLRTTAQVDGPVYQAGRDEGRADVAAQLRAIVDDLRARTEKTEAELAELKNRLCSRCHGTGWISESDGGGVCGCDVGDTLARAHAENNALRTRAEKAEAETHKSLDLAVRSARKHNAVRNELAEARRHDIRTLLKCPECGGGVKLGGTNTNAVYWYCRDVMKHQGPFGDTLLEALLAWHGEGE